MIFVTEYLASTTCGRPAIFGDQVEAESWEDAEEKAAKLGHTVLGILIEEIDAPEMRAFCDRESRRRDEEWS